MLRQQSPPPPLRRPPPLCGATSYCRGCIGTAPRAGARMCTGVDLRNECTRGVRVCTCTFTVWRAGIGVQHVYTFSTRPSSVGPFLPSVDPRKIGAGRSLGQREPHRRSRRVLFFLGPVCCLLSSLMQVYSRGRNKGTAAVRQAVYATTRQPDSHPRSLHCRTAGRVPSSSG